MKTSKQHHTEKNDMLYNASAAITFEEAREEELSSEESRKFGPLFHLVSTILIIAAAIIVLKVTGLYDGLNSTTARITACIALSFLYISAFRRGLSAR